MKKNDQLGAKPKWANRAQLIALFVVFLAPIFGAYWYQPETFMNHGDLHQPVASVAPLPLSMAENEKINGDWLFLAVVNQHCDTNCETTIRNVRQLRIMQNQHKNRLRSMVLYDELPASQQSLVQKYKPVSWHEVSAEKLALWQKKIRLDAPEEVVRDNRFYIIDPKGYLIISYPPSAEPQNIQKDIRRLLKTG